MQNYKARLKLGNFEFEVEGDKEFVKAQIDEWKAEKVESFKALLPGQTEINDTQPNRVDGINDSKLPNDKMAIDLPEFFSSYNAVSHPEKIVVFASFLENKQGKDQFTAPEILNAYDQVRLQAPKNIHDVLSKVYKRNEYILPKGKGGWKLSQTGLNALEIIKKK